MTLLLYELAGSNPAVRFSPHCWKTRMALLHKGLKADRVAWRFTEKDVIAFSGQKEVPVLKEDAMVVGGSWHIAQHLEEQYADRPALFGNDPGRAVTRFINAWADNVLLPLIAPIILMDIYKCIAVVDREYFRASREKRFGLSLEETVTGRPRSLSRMRKALSPLRQRLEKSEYLGGDIPSYADYCVFGMFMWSRCTSQIELLEDEDSILYWRDRLLDAFNGEARSAPRAHAKEY